MCDFIINHWPLGLWPLTGQYVTLSPLLLFKCSVPEKDGDKIHNTCTMFSHTGEQLTKYGKVSVSKIIVVTDMTAVTAT